MLDVIRTCACPLQPSPGTSGAVQGISARRVAEPPPSAQIPVGHAHGLTTIDIAGPPTRAGRSVQVLSRSCVCMEAVVTLQNVCSH
jgi:hypothetical protein